MTVVSLSVLALWTLAVLRLLGFRTTLSVRTFAAFLAFGALTGMMAMPFVRTIAAPYGEQGPYVNEVVSLGQQALLIAPVIWFFFVRGIFRTASVADAFLVAFMVGFGCDAAGTLLAAGGATTPLKGLSFWPPWQFEGDNLTVAGYGYWSALIALAIATAIRFDRRRLAVAIGSIIFLLVGTEHAALLGPIQKQPDNWIGSFGNLTSHGAATAWLAILALIGCSVAESLWAASAAEGQPRLKFEFLAELQSLLNTILSGRWRETVRLSGQLRLRRQVALARASLAHAPHDIGLYEIVGELERRLQSEPASSDEPGVTPPPRWRRPGTVQAMVWLCIAAAVFLPKSAGDLFWSIPLLHFQLGALPTVLCAFLMLTVTLRFTSAAGAPWSTVDADEELRFMAEKATLLFAALLVPVVWFLPNLDSLYPFPNDIAYYARMALPAFETTADNAVPHRIQVMTFLLLCAAAMSGVSVSRAARWRFAPITARRRAALRNAVNLAVISAAIWVGMTAWAPALEWSHHTFGAVFYKVQRWFALKENFAVTGNTVGALVTASVIAATCAAASLWYRGMLDRLERFFITI